MVIDDKIWDEKLQYGSEEAAKTSAWSSIKIDINKYLTTGKEIWLSDQSRIKEQAKFRSSSLEKAFEKQTKITEEQGTKQVKVSEVLKPEEIKEEIKSVEGHFPKRMTTNEIKKRKRWN